MDHSDVLARGLIELYHRGDLAPEEEARFEAHFFDCAECQQELVLARKFEHAFKNVVAEDAARATVALGLFGWLARRGRRAQLGALALLVLALALPFLGWQSEKREMARTLASSRQQAEAAQGRATTAGEELARAERERREEKQRLEAKVAELETRASAPGAGTVTGAARFATSVLLLSTLRGAGTETPAVHLGTPPGPIALAVDVVEDPSLASYQLTLRDARGKLLLSEGKVTRNALETLLLTLPAGFLAPGEYSLEVAGQRADGSSTSIARQSFRVVP